MRAPLLALILALPAAAQNVYLPPAGTGVSVTLKNQKTVTGTFLGEREGAVWLGVDGGEVGLAPEEIVLVRAQDNDEPEYRRRAAKAGRDAAAWWALSQWAQAKGLAASAQDAARRTIELAPEHAAARAALGEEKVGGRWLSADDAMAAKGYVLYQRQWMKKAQADALKAEAREERREQREEERLALERARFYTAPAASPAPRVYTYYGYGAAVIETEAEARKKGPYTVPWRSAEPFAPSFHEGYFRRAGF